jgi:hypothetical protein
MHIALLPIRVASHRPIIKINLFRVLKMPRLLSLTAEAVLTQFLQLTSNREYNLLNINQHELCLSRLKKVEDLHG